MRIRIVVAVLVLLAACYVDARSMPTCRLSVPAVEAAIAEKTRSLAGHEYCQFRRYDVIDDFDHDGTEDFAVTFNVEGPNGGGNHVLSFLHVYLSSHQETAEPLEIAVGERGTYLPDAITFDGKEIVLHIQKWSSGDALCCPSGLGEIRVRVDRTRGLTLPSPLRE
jgi:hypothetical protein